MALPGRAAIDRKAVDQPGSVLCPEDGLAYFVADFLECKAGHNLVDSTRALARGTANSLRAEVSSGAKWTWHDRESDLGMSARQDCGCGRRWSSIDPQPRGARHVPGAHESAWAEGTDLLARSKRRDTTDAIVLPGGDRGLRVHSEADGVGAKQVLDAQRDPATNLRSVTIRTACRDAGRCRGKGRR